MLAYPSIAAKNGTTKKQLAPAVPYDIIGGLPMISCPHRDSLPIGSFPEPVAGHLYNPVISFTYVFQGTLALVFALIIWWRYGSVRLFGRQIRNQYLSHHLWIWFFTAIGVSSVMDSTRYFSNSPYHLYANTSITIPTVPMENGTFLLSSDTDEEERNRARMEYLRNFDSGFLLGSTVLRSLATLFLVLALCWQLKYRSGGFNVINDRDDRRNTRRRTRLSPKNGYFAPNEAHDEESQQADDETAPFLSPASSSSSSMPANDFQQYVDGSLDPQLFSSSTVPMLTAALRGQINRPQQSWIQRVRSKYQKLRNPLLFVVEKLAIIQFLATLITLYVNITPIPTGNALLWAYVGLYSSAWIPVWFLMVRILITKTSPSPSSTARIVALSSGNATIQEAYGSKQGPTRWAKFFLFMGILLCGAFVFPPNIWSRFMHSLGTVHNHDENDGSGKWKGTPSIWDLNQVERTHPIHIPFGSRQIATSCIQPIFQGYVSFLDIIQWCGVVGLVFLIFFIRQEFMRCKERVVWATVSQVQDTFGFLRRHVNN